MSFTALSAIVLAAMLGPLLALPRRWHIPVVLGELMAGVVLGPTAIGYLDPENPTFTFLANIGFALVMFVAGANIPIRDPRLIVGLRTGSLRAAGVGALALLPATVLARAFHTGHTALYVVVMASSSAVLILPIIDSLALNEQSTLSLLPQVVIADAVCIAALPLVIDPHRGVRTAIGAVTVIACSGLLFLILRRLERSGYRARLHRLSEQRQFAMELRFSLIILFALAAIAVSTHVSILLAGFSFGLVVSAVGEPRRLARQLFALTEGFLSPLFFVWLGASLQLRQLVSHPSFILLGFLLALSAVAVHVVMRLTGQPVAIGALAAAQLGVPVAAATLGSQLRLLKAGESTALMLGALTTVATAIAAGSAAARASGADHSGTAPSN